MLKEIREVSGGSYRITTLDERWYGKPRVDTISGMPSGFDWFPSSTWICGYYPKGREFEKWLKTNGENADKIRDEAGATGSKVHYACEDIDKGIEIDLRTAKYMNNITGQLEELSQHEIDCILSYCAFIEEVKPTILANELVGFGEFYAGTIDKVFATEIDTQPGKRQIWLMDIKTSKQVKFEHTLQLSSYSHMNIDYGALGITDDEWKERKLAIIQVGYGPYKRHKITEVDDRFDFFKNIIYPLWQEDNPDAKPKQRDYPIKISSPFRVSQVSREGGLLKVEDNKKNSSRKGK